MRSVLRNQEKKRALIQQIKLEKGCVDCGYKENPVALEFDHRPGEPKAFQISRGVSNCGLDRLLEEIAKCDVVCANCHRIRSFNRKQHVIMGHGPNGGRKRK